MSRKPRNYVPENPCIDLSFQYLYPEVMTIEGIMPAKIVMSSVYGKTAEKEFVYWDPEKSQDRQEELEHTDTDL